MTDSADRFAAAVADRYRIERELGQGGMATVYLAHDIRHDRKVAIKVLREDLAASMGSARFLREIQIAAQLQHPNILPLLDSGDTGGFLHYVMPFVSGQSLRERLSREGELPVHEAVRLLVEVTDALAEAHQHGVVHRDIKPDNVMLSGRHALVADFGVAKAISEATGRNTITTLGVAVGTPAYMSPEQAAADPHIDHRSDIYSVGVMAYEMLSGRPPFTGSTPQQVLAAHVTEVPESVAKRRTAIPAALEQVVMRCLAKRPADRFQTAEELLSQLEALATPSTGITPTQTRPVTGWSEPATRRRWIAPVAVAVVALAAVAGWKLLRTPAAVLPTDVPRIQATFSGAAETGAMSPDGQKVAYSERECDQAFRCTVALVVQDIGGVGRLRAATGFAGIYRIDWSPDARRVQFEATASDGRYGTYIVPSLGGEQPRFMGAIDLRFFGNGDSMLIARRRDASHVDFIAMHALDDRGGDTVRMSRPDALEGLWTLSPDGRMHAISITTNRGIRYLVLLDRAAKTIDSLVAPRGEDPIGWSPAGNLIFTMRDTTNAEITAVIEREVSRSGRISRTHRVLLPSQPMIAPQVSRAGIAYLAGPIEAALYEASRTTEESASLTIRKAISTTTGLGLLMSGDGNSIITMRTPRGNDAQAVTQVSLVPFGGGPERQLTSGIRGVIDRSRTVDADAIVFVHRDGARARITKFEVATGRTTDLGTMPDTSDVQSMEVLRNGSIVWFAPTDSSGILRVREPSGTLRTITIPRVYPGVMEDSQYGDGIIGWGWKRPVGDSAVIFHIPAGASAGRALLLIGTESINGLRWAKGGLVEVVVGETAYTSAFYVLDPKTGALTRIGTIPLVGVTSVSFSRDGLRMSLKTDEPKRDVWIARVFD